MSYPPTRPLLNRQPSAIPSFQDTLQTSSVYDAERTQVRQEKSSISNTTRSTGWITSAGTKDPGSYFDSPSGSDTEGSSLGQPPLEGPDIDPHGPKYNPGPKVWRIQAVLLLRIDHI